MGYVSVRLAPALRLAGPLTSNALRKRRLHTGLASASEVQSSSPQSSLDVRSPIIGCIRGAMQSAITILSGEACLGKRAPGYQPGARLTFRRFLRIVNRRRRSGGSFGRRLAHHRELQASGEPRP